MTDKEIETFLFSAKGKTSLIRKATSKQLGFVMEYLNDALKVKSGHYSKNKFRELLKKSPYPYYSFISVLQEFHSQYVKRKKKKCKTFETFLKVLDSFGELQRKKEKANKEKLKLNKDEDLQQFINELHDLKIRFLNGSNTILADMISKHVYTPYTSSTILSKFYDKEK